MPKYEVIYSETITRNRSFTVVARTEGEAEEKANQRIFEAIAKGKKLPGELLKDIEEPDINTLDISSIDAI